jgi:hypothetical protein
MDHLQNREPEDDRLEELYWELCVLHSVAWGAVYIAGHYDALLEQAKVALLHEFERVTRMFDALRRDN